METKMKLLFEGWRKYVNEAEEKSFDQGPREQRATDLERAEELIEKYRLNTDQSSQQLLVDYDLDLDEFTDEIVYNATIQIAIVKISERSFEAEGDLEEEIRGIIDDASLKSFAEAQLSNINIVTEPYSAIQIYYVPVTPPWLRPGYQPTKLTARARREIEKARASFDPMKNLELFLKRVNYIADELEKIKIVEEITDWLADPFNEPSDAHLQQKLPLPEV